jgi:hypothetical protein
MAMQAGDKEATPDSAMQESDQESGLLGPADRPQD